VAKDKYYALELMGITAHVYADTFAHFGFSGVSSRANRVVASSIVTRNQPDRTGILDRFVAKFGAQNAIENFRNKITSEGGTLGTELNPAATGALGHGAVATFPDQPYLDWSYAYEMPDRAGRTADTARVDRKNAQDYEEAAAALHAMFRRLAALQDGLYADGTALDFETALRLRVRRIFTTVAPTIERIELWKAAVAAGDFSGKPGEQIPVYDPELWRQETENLKNAETPEVATTVPAYRFHRAGAMHRTYVLTELLPRMGVLVI
jgi:hypothetical protein